MNRIAAVLRDQCQVLDQSLDQLMDQSLDLTCKGHKATLMSPLIPSGWNMVWVAPVVKDNMAFFSWKRKHQPRWKQNSSEI